MIVRVNPHCRRREGLAGYDPDGIYLRNMDLDVLAMIHANQTKAYLVCYSIPGVPYALEWLKEQHVEVISKEKPSNWIEKKWPWWRQFHKANQEYDYKISYYAGPSIIFEDDGFLFDIYESPERAIQFLRKHHMI